MRRIAPVVVAAMLLAGFLSVPSSDAATTFISGSIIGISGDSLPAQVLVRSGSKTKRIVIPAGTVIRDKAGRTIPFLVVGLFDQVVVPVRVTGSLNTAMRLDDRTLNQQAVLDGTIRAINCDQKNLTVLVRGQSRALKLAFATTYFHGDSPTACSSLAVGQRVSAVLKAGSSRTLQRVVVSADTMVGVVTSKQASKSTAGDYTLRVSVGATTVKVTTVRSTQFAARNLKPMIGSGVRVNDRIEFRGLTKSGTLQATAVRNLTRGDAPAGNVVGQAKMTTGVRATGFSAKTVVGNVDLTGWAINTTVVGNYAYVANGTSGIDIVSLVDPSRPVVVSRYSTGYWASVVAANSTHAFIGDAKGITVLDIANPAAPVKVGYLLEHRDSMRTYPCRLEGNIQYECFLDWVDVVPNHMELSGNKLVVSYPGAMRNNGTTNDPITSYVSDSGVAFIDVTNPTTPQLVNRYPYNAMNATLHAVEGNIAYIAGRGRYDVLIGGTESDGLFKVDISNPAAPVMIGEVTGYDTSGTIAQIKGEYLYSYSFYRGVRIYRFNGTQLELVSALSIPGHAVSVDGTNMYVALLWDYEAGVPSKVVKYDIANPDRPILVGQVQDPRFMVLGDANNEGGASIEWVGGFGPYALALRGPDLPPALEGGVRTPASIFVLSFSK